MTKPKTARERFVEAMRVMLASEFCCGTLDKNHAEAACDAFADAECVESSTLDGVDGFAVCPSLDHESCRAAIRREVFGGE